MLSTYWLTHGFRDACVKSGPTLFSPQAFYHLTFVPSCLSFFFQLACHKAVWFLRPVQAVACGPPTGIMLCDKARTGAHGSYDTIRAETNHFSRFVIQIYLHRVHVNPVESFLWIIKCHWISWFRARVDKSLYIATIRARSFYFWMRTPHKEPKREWKNKQTNKRTSYFCVFLGSLMFLLAQRDSSDKFEICLFIKKLIRAPFVYCVVWLSRWGSPEMDWTLVGGSD